MTSSLPDNLLNFLIFSTIHEYMQFDSSEQMLRLLEEGLLLILVLPIRKELNIHEIFQR